MIIIIYLYVVRIYYGYIFKQIFFFLNIFPFSVKFDIASILLYAEHG